MRIERAENAGFCYGVRRAVEMTTQAARENAGSGRKVMTLGPLIHNEIVVDQLRREGVECVDSPDEVPAGALVIIRSHGVPEAVYEAIFASSEYYNWRFGVNRMIILIGDAEPHPKPRGLGKYSKDYVMGLAEAKDIKVKAILLPSD